jgi:hypothetical protein
MPCKQDEALCRTRTDDPLLTMEILSPSLQAPRGIDRLTDGMALRSARLEGRRSGYPSSVAS